MLEKCAGVCRKAHNPLFWATAAITLLWYTVTLAHFFLGNTFLEIPSKDIITDIYFTLLTAYVGVKQVSRIASGENVQQKRGELFVVGWLAMTILIAWLGAFGIGHPDVLEEIYPDPLRFVIVLYVAGEAAKNGGPIFQAVRDALVRNSTNNDNDTSSKPS